MDLQWSPVKKTNLITWGEEIQLYQIVQNESAVQSRALKLSNEESAVLVAKISDYPNPRAVDAYPGSFLEADGILAVGLANGKVVLTSFSGTILKKEFGGLTKFLWMNSDRHEVNGLAWNKYSPELLAVGLDKARSDCAVVVWDVAASGKLTNSFHSDALRPICEIGNSETAHSIAWVTAKGILVGMNGKNIRHYDLRDPQPKMLSTASTKATYGLSADGSDRIASFADNQVVVWDVRNLEKPFVAINHNKPIMKIAWSPNRRGLLACVEKDCDYVTLHDVQHAASSIEEGEPTVLERRLTPFIGTMGSMSASNGGLLSIASFTWNPHEENVLTAASSTGYLRNSTVYERITLNWSTTSKLGWSDGKKMIQFFDNTDSIYASLDDISVKMKQRAMAGYGLQGNLKDNAKFVDEPDVANIWDWLDYCRLVTEKEKYRVPYIGSVKFPGARVALRLDAMPGMNHGSLKSDVVYNSSFDSGSNSSLNVGKTYRNDERSFAQQLCGWGADMNDSSGSSLRRAAISLFHLKLRQCISILSESGNSIIGMAIAGASDTRNSLWKEMAEQNSIKLGDPFVRAIFSFLTDTDGSYEQLLSDSGISVPDRVGFACSFLSDSKIASFMTDLMKELETTGNLEGLILTGMTSQAIPILQRYLDITGDIQTVSLLVIHTMADAIHGNSHLRFWIEQYRELLDAWKLWELRAELDILTNANNPLLITPAEVTISCNFCGKNISPTGLGAPGRSLSLFPKFPSNNPKAKLSCCPSCRKPLPRCAICLLNMGTILGISKDSGDLMSTPQALSWYTWCQTCRHGGHTLHLQEWFKHQMECPVTGCTCKCMTLDKVIDFPS